MGKMDKSLVLGRVEAEALVFRLSSMSALWEVTTVAVGTLPVSRYSEHDSQTNTGTTRELVEKAEAQATL